MEKVLVITGPTAVGKTKISIEAARALNGEIINGDAMQVYNGYDVLTDKIAKEDMQEIPHHLFSFVDINTNYSVYDYQLNIRNKIKEITSRGKLPIIVGGTGFYIKAALYDYEFLSEETNHHNSYDNYDNETLYNLLLSIDSKSAQIIHPNNRKRVIRALEIFDDNNKTKSALIDKQKHKLLYNAKIVVLTLPKEILNTRINQRVLEMFDKGIVEEVKNNPTTSIVNKAIGYPQVIKLLNNEYSKDECINEIQCKTRQYGKRQMTWFRHQFEAIFLEKDANTVNNIVSIMEE